MPELAFVRSSADPGPWAEIVDALRDELTLLGVGSSVFDDELPEAVRRSCVPVVAGADRRVPPADVDGAVLLTGAHASSPAFERVVSLARGGSAAAVLDLHASSARLMRWRGLAAHHLQLGHTARWDAFHTGARSIDIVFLGRESGRRARLLAGSAEAWWPLRTRVLLEEARIDGLRSLASFVGGDARARLLRDARVLVNLHRDDGDGLETHRVVLAMLAGCAVVSERSGDVGPLVPGEDFLSGRGDRCHLIARHLLDDPQRRDRLARSAYERLRTAAPLAAAAARLAEVADDLPVRASGAAGRFPRAAGTLPYQPPKPADPEAARTRQRLKNAKLEQLRLHREHARREVERARGTETPDVEIAHRSPGWNVARRDVSVIVPVFEHAEHVGAALTAVSIGRFRDLELIVVDDGSSDGSGEHVRAWSQLRPSLPLLLLRHPVNRGLPHARNSALRCARGRHVFALDADNVVLPTTLERLRAALEADHDAAFSYGIVAAIGDRGPSHLLSQWPWRPERLRRGNYIDAMAMIRADRLRKHGGYSTDPRLHGWEDFALWCAFAEAGESAAFVPEIVGRYRHSEESMLSLTNLAFGDAFEALAARAPRLMAGLEIPR